MKETKFKQTELGKIPEDWEVVKLGEIANFETGKLDSHYAEENGMYPFFTCSPKPLRINSYSFDCEAVLLAGNNANGIFHLNYHNGKFDVYQRTYIVTPKDERLNLKYLYFHLYLTLNLLKDISQGTATKFLTMRIFNDLEVILPPIEEQKRIADILWRLDDKIELNQEMNKTLESFGQALFKHWFIDFEFPNENDKPYKSSGGEMVYSEDLEKEIPKGWEVKNLGDILTLLKDGSHNPPKRVDSGIKFLAGATNIKHFEILFDRCSYIKQEDYDKIHKYWTIETKDVLLTIVGTVGNVALVNKKDLPFSLQRSIAVLRAGPLISYLFLYFLLNTINFKNYLISRLNPTAQPGIYLGTLSKFKLCLPSNKIINIFDSIVELLVNKMQNNDVERKCLESIRNTLLPKLMSGKIRVKVPETEATV